MKDVVKFVHGLPHQPRVFACPNVLSCWFLALFLRRPWAYSVGVFVRSTLRGSTTLRTRDDRGPTTTMRSHGWRGSCCARFVAQSSRDLVRVDHPSGHSPRLSLHRPRPDPAHRRLRARFNRTSHLFTWTATTDPILAKCTRLAKETSGTRP